LENHQESYKLGEQYIQLWTFPSYSTHPNLFSKVHQLQRHLIGLVVMSSCDDLIVMNREDKPGEIFGTQSIKRKQRSNISPNRYPWIIKYIVVSYHSLRIQSLYSSREFTPLQFTRYATSGYLFGTLPTICKST
jgi:hypothetical protein